MEKLDLFDVSIHEKDWKQFRKTASQEELFLLGVGVKYKLNTTRKISYLSALGLILSVVIGLVLIFCGAISAGLIILVAGYLVFSFLASKIIRYKDSYTKILKRLKTENKKELKALMPVSGGLAFFDALMQIILMYLTIPYQLVLVLLGMIAPNFTIAKNGVLIAIPKGYDIGNLASIGEYYAGYSLFGEIETYANKKYEEWHKYEATFINDAGCEQTVYSADGKKFYYKDGSYAGESSDGGKTIIKN